MPNSLVVEGLAQTGGLLVCEHSHFTEKVMLAKIPKVEFFGEALPGDTLLYTATIEYIKDEGALVTATSHKDGRAARPRWRSSSSICNDARVANLFDPETFSADDAPAGGIRGGPRRRRRSACGRRPTCCKAAPRRLPRAVDRRHENHGGAAMRRRVVVTGIGCVTPLGADIETMWKRLLAGESGVGYTTLFDASNFPTKISAEVRNWDLSDVGENPADWKYQGRHTHFAVGAAQEGHGRLRRAWTPARSHPLRRLHRQRRRPAGLRPFHAR